MSRRPNGGYANGYGERDDDYGERRRPQRSGGYGGFSEREEAPAVQRPPSLERSQARRRSGERRGDGFGGGGGGGRFGTGSSGQRMEAILQTIQQNFDFMTNDKCVPIEVALKLMDPSSLGLASQYDMFLDTHQNLQRALKAIVNGMCPMCFSRAALTRRQSITRASIAPSAPSTRSNRVCSSRSNACALSRTRSPRPNRICPRPSQS